MIEGHKHEGRREKLIAKIFARCKIVPGPLDTPCYEWQGRDSGKGRGGGYGRVDIDGGTVAVHRAIYTLFFGIIPPKKQIDHKCKNRRCCNPAHLEMVTHKQNQRRRRKK
jgi:hypothetical protein